MRGGRRLPCGPKDYASDDRSCLVAQPVDLLEDRGRRTVSGPAAVAAYELAHRRLGKLPWARLFEPAIRLARDGIVMDWYGTLVFGTSAVRLHKNPEAKRVYYREGGAPYRPPTGFEPADRLLQPELARSLEAIARGGAKVLYQGELAGAIADDIRALGGILSREDFASYEAGAPPPQTVDYRGARVVTLPGLTGGPTVARALGLLDRDDLRTHPQLGAQSLHRMAVAVRAAFAERLGAVARLPHTPHGNAGDPDPMGVALTRALGGGLRSAGVIKGTRVLLTNGTV